MVAFLRRVRRYGVRYHSRVIGLASVLRKKLNWNGEGAGTVLMSHLQLINSKKIHVDKDLMDYQH